MVALLASFRWRATRVLVAQQPYKLPEGAGNGWDRNPYSPLVPLGLAHGGLNQPIPHPRGQFDPGFRSRTVELFPLGIR